MNFIIQLDSHGKLSMYEQLYRYVKKKIIDGDFSPGERLPSTRLLAQNLGISRNTVERAYDQLVAEGYIEGRVGSGFRVSTIEGLFLLPKASETKKATGPVRKQNPLVCDFSAGGIDEESFPMDAWRRISRGVLSEQERYLSGGDPLGEYGLREEISRYLQGARGVKCSPDQIIIGAGNDYLLMLLLRIMNRENIVAMEYPTYSQAHHVLCSSECRTLQVPMDEYGMNVKELAVTQANLVYVMPSHQFPTGIVMPLNRRLALLQWAYGKEDRYIIEDDYDSELRYRGRPIPALQGNDDGGRVIYLGTFSQSIAPSIRVSYMVLPEALMEKYREQCGVFSNTVARIQQHTIKEFMQQGYFERHLNRMRKKYKEKRDLLLTELGLTEKSPQISGAEAGTHLLYELPAVHNGQAVAMEAERQGVRVHTVPGKENALILSYGGLSKDEICAGARILKNIIKK
ncbi:MAG: PLP-dependent aminotransferase family protein [Lachnospiraceae bacterium]